MMGSAFFGSVRLSGTSDRIHQHLQPNLKEPCQHEEDVFCTHLPIVSIETGGQEMTIEMLDTGEGYQRKSDEIQAQISIVNQQDTNNHLEDIAEVKSLARVNYRGHSSLLFDKKSYKINFINEDLSENKEMKVMGMPAHDEWVLNGPFLDKTLIRNYLCMNIAGEIRSDTPEVRFCELFVDGKYQGVYIAMENVSRGEQRVNVSSYKKNHPFTSYIIRADRDVNAPGEINNFAKYTLRMPSHTAMEVIYPSEASEKEELKRYIEKEFSKFEKALYSYDYNDPVYGYKALIDVDSFVTYLVINEFFKNYDAALFSTYFYKDLQGKINIGPVWDFNNACDNYMEIGYDEAGFGMINRTYYFMLTKDEEFIDRVIAKYRELRKTYLSEEYLINYIDQTVEFLGPAIDRNYEVWGYSFNAEELPSSSRLTPVERNVESYEEAIKELKDFLIKRGRWLDRNIDNLKQYAHKSKVKKYNH